MVKVLLKAFLVITLLAAVGQPRFATAVPGSTVDSSDSLSSEPSSLENQGSAEDIESLIHDAQQLFQASRSIDARTKLQRALRIAPKDYRPHLYLGAYYLSEVGHFRLANKYLNNAEKLFEKTYGSERDGTLDPNHWQEHARLLLLLSESRLNLDDYKGALAVLDRFEGLYWDKGYPGTRAWVLMKLKRVDEAIRVAQAGLMRGAEPGRTYNILGILFSLKENRELALEAFARSIRAEAVMGYMGQVATPLNNSGEVYRELFDDGRAEAAWQKAVQLPDGCEHILPSLNLAILYIDQLRILQAARALDDFEACFAAKAIREDTEHRSLLALARGRIALRSGEFDKALELLKTAADRQQWFGKIGTNENDMRFATSVSSGQAFAAKANVLRREASGSITDRARKWLQIPWLELRAWWHFRRAREISLEELNDFEDLWVRHTDAMLEYPTLGEALAGYPERSMDARAKRMTEIDSRKYGKYYYSLYLGTNLQEHGNDDAADKALTEALAGFREIDRMARAEATVRLIKIKEGKFGFWTRPSQAERAEVFKLKQDLLSLLPSHFRTHNILVPVTVSLTSTSGSGKAVGEQVRKSLLRTQFKQVDEGTAESSAYRLTVDQATAASPKAAISISLYGPNGARLASLSDEVADDSKDIAALVNRFLDEVFQHRSDPPAEPVPELSILEGVY